MPAVAPPIITHALTSRPCHSPQPHLSRVSFRPTIPRQINGQQIIQRLLAILSPSPPPCHHHHHPLPRRHIVVIVLVMLHLHLVPELLKFVNLHAAPPVLVQPVQKRDELIRKQPYAVVAQPAADLAAVE